MLENEATLERLQKINIQGGLLPQVTLLDDLVRLLNETRTAQGKRIVFILEKMLELEEMTRSIKPEEPMIAALEWKRTDPKKFRVHCEIEKRSAMLQRELSKYRFTPHAGVVMGGGGQGPSQWAAWWTGNEGARRERHLRMVPSEAMELILKLTQIGYLTRLRRCKRCNKWLYAKFQHQTFCSRECQQKQFTERPEWKAHRRAYMRDRYHRFVKNPLRGRKAR
jgi:hypothetical protein